MCGSWHGIPPGTGTTPRTQLLSGGTVMAARDDGSAAGLARDGVDWQAVERSPEFRELVAKRRTFVAPATVFFLACYAGFILLAGYAPEFMGRSLYEGFTVGYGLA